MVRPAERHREFIARLAAEAGVQKGSLAVNTAEKQRAQSISHLRRQAIARGAEQASSVLAAVFVGSVKLLCSGKLLLSIGARPCSHWLHKFYDTTTTRNDAENSMTPRRAGAPTHIVENSLEWFRSVQMHKMIPEESICGYTGLIQSCFEGTRKILSEFGRSRPPATMGSR